MLRATPEHVASHAGLRHGKHAFAPAIGLRPRVPKPSPVFREPAPRTIAVRGHVRNGSAAALIIEPTGICIVSADRSRRRRVRRFPIAEILSVEEHRMAHSTELVVVTASTEISVADVDIAQAWTFCRELRELILSRRKGS